MEVIDTDQFLNWARGFDIGFDERYPGARSLVYLPGPRLSRFWMFPDDGAAWPHFAACFLEGIDPWQQFLLWPRAGRWPVAPEAGGWWNEAVRDVVLRGASIPRAWSGAARFGREEVAAVVAVMFAAMLAGGFPDDLYLVPDHGRQFLQVNHHDVVHAEFREEARLLEFVAYLEAKGHALPTEVPDATFKQPPWMREGTN
jgi:hypothetical protein